MPSAESARIKAPRGIESREGGVSPSPVGEGSGEGGEKFLNIRLFLVTECTNVTDRRTETAWRLGRACIASRGKNRDFQPISGFITVTSNDTKYGHSYYGKTIENRMQSIERCHFQWPRMTQDQDFNGMPLCDVEYLRNGKGTKRTC